jgi:hypothetical protein
MSMLTVLALLVGCNPQDAEVSGTYVAYLANEGSENVIRLERFGVPVSEQAADLSLTPVDCRDLDYLREDAETTEEADAAVAAERLPGVDYDAECLDAEGNRKEPSYFTWLNQYSYWKSESAFGPDAALEPWRSEAVLTTEGDLQLTVHMKIPGMGDMRFGWVIDPSFAPMECTDVDGASAEVPVDGDWLAGWSEGEEGTLWFINGGSYQINPSDNGEAWYLPPEWQAAYSFARFVDEPFYSHATDYADIEGQPLWVNSYTDGVFEAPRGGAGGYAAWRDSITEAMSAVTDFTDVGKSDFAPTFKIDDNSWREVDDAERAEAAGFDGWLGVSPGWVRIDNPEAIVAGTDTPVTGEFQIYLEGVAAASKLMVKGEFKINNIREDVWGYDPGMEELKWKENGTVGCDGEPIYTEE